MRKLFGVMLVVVFATAFALADNTVQWSGQTWDAGWGYGSLSLVNGGMQVTSQPGDASTWGINQGIAHTQLSGLTADKNPWVQASFNDDPSNSTGGLLAFQNPAGTNPVWGEVGYDASISATQYVVYVGNQTDGTSETVVLGDRTAGNHTLDAGLSANGTLDFYLDNQLVWTSGVGHPDSFSDVYLYANSPASTSTGSVLFTSFSAGTGYQRGPNGTFDPVPEPASLLLFASGLGAMGGIRRFRRRK